MTKQERMEALLNRQPLDRVPVWAAAGGFCVAQCDRSVTDGYHGAEKFFRACVTTAARYGWQDLPYTGYAAMGAWEFGGKLKPPSGKPAQGRLVQRYPVTGEADAQEILIPADVTKAGIVPKMMEIANLQAQASAEHIVCPMLSPFTTAGNLTGMDILCKWMIKRPELVHRLLRLSTDFMLSLAGYWVDTFGPQRILATTADPSAANQLISPRHFEQFALPYTKDLHEGILGMGVKHILYHPCGEQNLNLPYLAQIPLGDPGIVSVGHEIDLETLSPYFPHDVIMGNVDPTVIQARTPEQIYELTRRVIAKGRKHPGGFMLAPGCEMPPLAPAENVWALMQAVSDFGWYE